MFLEIAFQDLVCRIVYIYYIILWHFEGRIFILFYTWTSYKNNRILFNFPTVKMQLRTSPFLRTFNLTTCVYSQPFLPPTVFPGWHPETDLVWKEEVMKIGQTKWLGCRWSEAVLCERRDKVQGTENVWGWKECLEGDVKGCTYALWIHVRNIIMLERWEEDSMQQMCSIAYNGWKSFYLSCSIISTPT